MSNLVTTQPSRFSVIQPSLLAPMQVLEQIDTEAIVAARMAQLKTFWQAADPTSEAQYDVETLEFDPIKIQSEAAAYFELLVRDRVNQACRSVTLAYAVGSDLDAIGSRYPYGVPRQAGELDDAYRTRLWLSPSILSLNGPGQGTFESYVFWAMSAPLPSTSPRLKHAAAFTIPATGKVIIPVMSASAISSSWMKQPAAQNTWLNLPGAQPKPTSDQISAVYQYITAADAARCGLTDVVSVVSPKVINATIDADLTYFPGVDLPTLIAQTTAAVSALISAINWLGADLTRLSVMGALAQAGMYNAALNQPAADVVTDVGGVVNITSATLRFIGSGE